jgi:hypothetical protein
MIYGKDTMEQRFQSWLEIRPKSQTIRLRDIQLILDLLKECFIDAFNNGYELGIRFKMDADAEYRKRQAEKKMNSNKSAFPYAYKTTETTESGIEYTATCCDPGMTIKEYAAIHLKVPRSGDSEIDGMIRESVRRDFAERMIDVFCEPTSKRERMEIDAKMCFVYANAMLAEWEKEAER